MIIKIKYQFNEKYIMKKIDKNYYKNKMITGKKETQILKTQLDPMLNYKIN